MKLSSTSGSLKFVWMSLAHATRSIRLLQTDRTSKDRLQIKKNVNLLKRRTKLMNCRLRLGTCALAVVSLSVVSKPTESEFSCPINLHIYKFEFTHLHVSDENLQIPKRFLLENLDLPISFIFLAAMRSSPWDIFVGVPVFAIDLNIIFVSLFQSFYLTLLLYPKTKENKI